MAKKVAITDKWELISIFIDGYVPADWVCCFYYKPPCIRLDCYLTRNMIEMYEEDTAAFKKAIFNIKGFEKAVLMPKYEFIENNAALG